MIQSCYCLCMQTLCILFKIIIDSSYSWIFTFSGLPSICVIEWFNLWHYHVARWSGGACTSNVGQTHLGTKEDCIFRRSARSLYISMNFIDWISCSTKLMLLLLYLSVLSFLLQKFIVKVCLFFFLFGLLEVQHVIMCKIRG